MIYFTGDTHHNIDTQKIVNFTPQTKDNILIVLGDWGGLWYRDRKKNYKLLKKWCKWQKEKNFTLFTILGNHENYSLIKTLPKKEIIDENNHIRVKHLRVVNPFTKEFKCNLYILENGFHIIQNKKIFAIRGALSVDKEYRTENVDYWKEEELNEIEKEEIINFLKNNNEKFDYIISHTAPAFIVKQLIEKYNVNPKKLDNTSLFLDKIYNKYLKNNFKFWLFGHFHLDVKINNFIGLYNSIVSEKELFRVSF